MTSDDALYLRNTSHKKKKNMQNVKKKKKRKKDSVNEIYRLTVRFEAEGNQGSHLDR